MIVTDPSPKIYFLSYFTFNNTQIKIAWSVCLTQNFYDVEQGMFYWNKKCFVKCPITYKFLVHDFINMWT